MSIFVDAESLDAPSTYRLLVGSVMPRPIAWVTSGRPPKPTNLAPFSAFAWVSQHPAMLGITINRRPGSVLKDTFRNIVDDGEYVVNVGSWGLLDRLHASSERLEPDESEAEALGLETLPATAVGVPRLADVPISMECRLERVLQFSPTGGDFVVGRVVGWNIREDVLEDGRIAPERVQPIGRLAGPRYCTPETIVELAAVPGG